MPLNNSTPYIAKRFRVNFLLSIPGVPLVYDFGKPVTRKRCTACRSSSAFQAFELGRSLEFNRAIEKTGNDICPPRLNFHPFEARLDSDFSMIF